jgi:hypothetical protein
MSASRPTSRPPRFLLLLLICAVATAMLPASPASAAVEFSLQVDDTTAEFGDIGSSFLLSSLVEQTGEESAPVSRLGGVQLAPVGSLDFKVTGSNIPQARTDIRAAVIGRYIFAVGGTNNTNFVDTVYRGTVDQQTGLVDWQADNPLPAVAHSATGGFTAPIAGRGNAAVTSFVTNAANGDGFLYVIGGAVRLGNTFSSRSVVIGTVQGGDIVSWSDAGLIPASYNNNVTDTAARGVDGASAFTMTVGSTTYIYLVGGQQRPTTGSTIPVTRRILYGSINTGSGAITWISNGGAGSFFDIPTSPSNEEGFWNGALVSGLFPDANGALQRAFFLTGGQVRQTGNLYSSRVVKGIVNNDGTISFDGSASPGPLPVGTDGSLLDARNLHGAVLWANTLYTFGGRPGAGSTATDPEATSSPITAQRVLTTFQGGNFQRLIDDTPQALPTRTAGGYAVVPSTRPGIAYAYYIGGTTGTTESSIVSQATIGEPPANPSYPADGWYFSAPFPIQLGGSSVTVKTLKWRAKDIAGGADLEISYRTSTDPDCTTLASSSLSWTEILDATTGSGYSQEGPNEAPAFQEQANCFQYRVRIVRGADSATTPTLTRLSVVVERPGSADLKFVGDGVSAPVTDGTITGLGVTITNQNEFELPTISADYGDGGTFYLDLFIFPPGVTPVVPTVPMPNEFPASTYNRATIQINRSLMSPGHVQPISAGDVRWQYSTEPGLNSNVVNGPLDLSRLFPAPGTYTIIAVVDGPDCGLIGTIGCVRETAQGFTNPNAAEENNVSAQVQLTISTPPPTGPGDGEDEEPTIFLPITQRP